ncbi:uncharacterized protein LOC129591739 [Paramacrobiotus metropolitanus]|uniref:uncharacterized protein LOC129591739 n=1 Tax=Paramacrobiotus metropolitanus TaxID=2943436 RepID=UPI0024457DF2|nr:uncharacterized protein LOC129591739 [Paramacrobiotus metropolitanus]
MSRRGILLAAALLSPTSPHSRLELFPTLTTRTPLSCTLFMTVIPVQFPVRRESTSTSSVVVSAWHWVRLRFWMSVSLWTLTNISTRHGPVACLQPQWVCFYKRSTSSATFTKMSTHREDGSHGRHTAPRRLRNNCADVAGSGQVQLSGGWSAFIRKGHRYARALVAGAGLSGSAELYSQFSIAVEVVTAIVWIIIRTGGTRWISDNWTLPPFPV